MTPSTQLFFTVVGITYITSRLFWLIDVIESPPRKQQGRRGAT